MINGRIVPLSTQLHNSDIVKIITSPQGSPSQDWLKIARSSKTRSKIRNHFRQAEKTDRNEKIARGWEALEKELRKRGLTVENQEDFAPGLNKVARDLGLSGKDDVLAAVGAGTSGPSTVAQKLVLAYLQQHHPADDLSTLVKENPPVRRHDSDVIVEGEGGVSVVLANCCAPIPGDAIVGYSTRTRGITIHRIDCPNILNAQMGRVVQVSWGRSSDKLYTARLKAEAVDRANLIRDAAQSIGLGGGSISGIKASTIGNSLMRMKIELRVRDLEHLYGVIAKLNAVKDIIEVTRG